MSIERTVTIATSDLLSVQQAADLLNRPKVTLYRWLALGKVLGVRFGGVLYVPRSEIERIKG